MLMSKMQASAAGSEADGTWFDSFELLYKDELNNMRLAFTRKLKAAEEANETLDRELRQSKYTLAEYHKTASNQRLLMRSQK
jgi:outer membrane protein TolC